MNSQFPFMKEGVPPHVRHAGKLRKACCCLSLLLLLIFIGLCHISNQLRYLTSMLSDDNMVKLDDTFCSQFCSSLCLNNACDNDACISKCNEHVDVAKDDDEDDEDDEKNGYDSNTVNVPENNDSNENNENNDNNNNNNGGPTNTNDAPPKNSGDQGNNGNNQDRKPHGEKTINNKFLKMKASHIKQKHLPLPY